VSGFEITGFLEFAAALIEKRAYAFSYQLCSSLNLIGFGFLRLRRTFLGVLGFSVIAALF